MTAEQINSRIDFAKLMKDKIFDPAELISVDEVRKEVNKQKNILGPRTIEFYARYGALKKSLRIAGDKRAYYKRDYIFDALGLIFILKTKCGMKLSKIRDFMKIIKHNPRWVFTDLMGLEDEFNEREEKIANSLPKDSLSLKEDFEAIKTDLDLNKQTIGEKYIEVIKNKRKVNMLDLIEMYESNAKKTKQLELQNIDPVEHIKEMNKIWKGWTAL